MGKKKKGTQAVGFCLDESGSMILICAETITGFNEFLTGLGNGTKLWLTKFSSQRFGQDAYREHCAATPAENVSPLDERTYQPGGNTPLLDAIGHTIRSLEQNLAAQPEQPDSVLFVIQTDGEENASTEFTRDAVVALIQQKEAQGWRFVYLGANMGDVEAAGAATSLGLDPSLAVSYEYAATGGAYKGVTAAASMLRSNPTASAKNVADEIKSSVAKDKRR